MDEIAERVVYQSLCGKLARIFEIGFSSRDKDAILALMDEAQKELVAVADHPDVPRPQQYSCAIIVSLMRLWPAYTTQAKDQLGRGVSDVNAGLTRSSLSGADAAVVKAIVHQFETNQVVELDERVINNANPDLYAAARFIQDLAPYVRVSKENL